MWLGRFPPHRRVTFGCVGLASVATVWACGSAPPVSHVEDKARLDVPIAICRKALASEDVGDAGTPRLDSYWSVIFPSFRGFGTTLKPEDVDCVGSRPAVEFSSGASAGLSPTTSDDLTISTAEDGRQAAWLRLSKGSDGNAAGLLAIVRPRTTEIDVYAIGRYRGSIKHSRFDLLALGSTKVVVAHDEGCAEAKVDAECDSTLLFYAEVGGKLLPSADTFAQRVRFANVKTLGRVQYRLTADPPVVDGKSLRVHEKLQVRDSNDEDVRKAEGDRTFVLGADGRLIAQQESLWSQVNKSP